MSFCFRKNKCLTIAYSFYFNIFTLAQVESEPRKIAGHYLRGWFIIDLVAAIPFDLIWSKTGEEDVGNKIR